MKRAPWFYRLAEAVAPGMVQHLREQVVENTADDGRESPGFKRLTDGGRDLPEFTRQRELQVVFWLWRTNAIARRVLEITADFVAGKGFRLAARDPLVEKHLRAHWDDPFNSWDLKLKQRVLELSMFGELIIPVSINETTHRLRIGYVDPVQVTKVVSHEKSVETITEIEIKRQDGKTAWLKMIRAETDEKDSTRTRFVGLLPGEHVDDGGKYESAAFFFRVNHVTNALRGSSDLAPVADWIDMFDQLLFNAVERSAMVNAFVWDVKVTGAQPAALEKRKRDIMESPPRPGTANVHNEQEEWRALVPEFGAGEHEVMAKIVRRIIIAGMGISETWLGSGEDANRASAIEMGTPIFRRLESRQAYVVAMLDQILRYQVQLLVEGGIISEKDESGGDRDLSFSVHPSQIAPGDDAQRAAILASVTSAVSEAQAAGFIDAEEARAIVRRVAAPFGISEDEVMSDEPGTDEFAAPMPGISPARPEVVPVGMSNVVDQAAKAYASLAGMK